MKKFIYVTIILIISGCSKLDNKKPVYLNIQASGEVEVISRYCLHYNKG